MAPSPLQILERARTFNGLGNIVLYGIGGAILAVFLNTIRAVQAIFGVLTTPLGEFGTQLGRVVAAIVGGPVDIIRQGVRTTIVSIAPGAAWAIGPLTFALSIAAIGLGLYVLGQILKLPFTSDTIPFSFTDIPLLGVEEDQEQG